MSTNMTKTRVALLQWHNTLKKEVERLEEADKAEQMARSSSSTTVEETPAKQPPASHPRPSLTTSRFDPAEKTIEFTIEGQHYSFTMRTITSAEWGMLFCGSSALFHAESLLLFIGKLLRLYAVSQAMGEYLTRVRLMLRRHRRTQATIRKLPVDYELVEALRSLNAVTEPATA